MTLEGGYLKRIGMMAIAAIMCAGLSSCGNGIDEPLLPSDTEEPGSHPGENDDPTEYEIDVMLPERIYAVAGQTLQLFFRGAIGAVNPYNYDILVSCAHGKKYPRYFEYRPTADDIGTTTFTITVKNDNGKVLGKAGCDLVTVDAECTEELHVLTFGDSLTSSGDWVHHADECLPDNVKFCGEMNKDGTGYFGVGGWSWNRYITVGVEEARFQVEDVSLISIGATYGDADGNIFKIKETNITGSSGNVLASLEGKKGLPAPASGTLTRLSGSGDKTMRYTGCALESANPLWNGTEMSFRNYVNTYAGGRVDVVCVLLGWNEVKPWMTDFTVLMSRARRFCQTLHREYPRAKVKIMGLQIPSVTGGIGNSYGATGTGYADGYGLARTVLNLNRAYEDLADELGDYVEFLGVSCQFDSEYNMPYTEADVNLYNPDKEMLGTNGLHPSLAGYKQIGDVVVRAIYGQSADKDNSWVKPVYP